MRIFLLSTLHFVLLLSLIPNELLHPLQNRKRLHFLPFCCSIRVREEAVALFDALVNISKQARTLRITLVAFDVLPLITQVSMDSVWVEGILFQNLCPEGTKAAVPIDHKLLLLRRPLNCLSPDFPVLPGLQGGDIVVDVGQIKRVRGRKGVDNTDCAGQRNASVRRFLGHAEQKVADFEWHCMNNICRGGSCEAECAFYGTSIGSLSIPDSVVDGQGCFAWCQRVCVT